MKIKTLAVLALLPIATLVSAQEVSAIKVEPAQSEKGKPVKVTATTTVKEGFGINCGLRINYGDGQSQDFKIIKQDQLITTVDHTYAYAGNFEVWAEGKRIGTHLGCPGKKVKTNVTITEPPKPVAAAPAAAPAAASAPAAGACPEGWKMKGKPNKKTGAFTCTAKPGTAAPAAKLACPGTLSYVENTKKGVLGCQP